MGLNGVFSSNVPVNAQLSQKQINEIAQACIENLTKHGRIRPELLTFLSSNYPSKSTMPTSATPLDCPELLSSDKMPSSAPASHQFTVPQLHRYFGFRQLKNWSCVLDVVQDNISLNLNHGEIPITLRNVANLKKSRLTRLLFLVQNTIFIMSTWILVTAIVWQLVAANIVLC